MGEVKQSAQLVLHCAIVRPFNKESVETKRATIDNVNRRERTNRVKGRERIQIVCTYVSDLNEKNDVALADISDDLYNQVLRDMSSDKNKSSADELQQQI